MGFAHWLNERRQIAVFYYNIYLHYQKYGKNYNYKAKANYEQSKIPKIIHYCWFGMGKQNDLIKNVLNLGEKYYQNMMLYYGMKIVFLMKDILLLSKHLAIENGRLSQMWLDCMLYTIMVEYIWIRMWK